VQRCKSNHVKQLFNYNFNNYDNEVLILDYINNKVGKGKANITYNEISIEKKNGDYNSKINRNGYIIEKEYKIKSNTENIISYCMMDGNNNGELRYRGKYTEEKKNNKTINKKIIMDNNIEYDEVDGNVLVDKIRNINLDNEYIIGWKVAKNVNGEIRIIKLSMNNQSKIVTPINEEIFIHGKKARSNYAIVLDIQLPILDEEISVVPNEMIAYSYVYCKDENKFEYHAGKEVYPDSFDENENIGCGNGIHFYLSKSELFQHYID